jgi:tripartite-type tricarboxylate transporter receptor subunit TctC
MHYTRKAALAFGLIILPGLPPGVATAAQSAPAFPDRPIRLIVAQTPGSSIDAMSRLVAAKMGELLGQNVVVDNRTGAGGTIGGAIVAHAEPNGYTLFASATASQVIGPQLFRGTTTYDPLKDFAPISLFAITQNVLVTTNEAPYRSVKELIAYAKANPGKINWANAGTGFQSHLAGVLFTHIAKIDVLHVPYKGAGLMVSSIFSGESHVAIGPAPAWMRHVEAGRARALAMGGEKRSPLWPDLPTIGESGLPGYVSNGWAGLSAPAKTPKPLLGRLHAMLLKAVNDPATNEALKRVGAEPQTGTPAEFAALIAKDWKSFGDAIRIANLKIN